MARTCTEEYMPRRCSFVLSSFVLVGGLSACGGEEEDSIYATGATAATSPTSASTQATQTDETTDSQTSDPSTGPLLDMSGQDPDGPQLEGCEAVDLLFVIDNSASMQEFQAGLAQAFPGFIDSIYASLPEGIDIHLGVTTTSFSEDVGHSCAIGCLYYDDPPGCPGGEGCNRADCYNDFTTQANGYQGRLYEYEGKRYFETNTANLADKEALTDWFVSVASAVGETGSGYEFSTGAASRAFENINADYNAGFLRDEGAVLFLFFLTDQWDESILPLATYVDNINAAKAGCNAAIEAGSCVVTSGLLNPCVVPNEAGGNASGGFGDWGPGGYGPDGQPGDLLWQFMVSFNEEPAWGSILDTQTYAEVVGEGLAQVITQTCDSIPPVE